MSVLDWANRYAHEGWRVLPVNGKRPTLKGWPDAATTDPNVFSKWFAGTSNIGVATGSMSGIVVLDIDPRNGGDLSLKRLEREICPLPVTVKARTGGGGSHFVFEHFEGAKSCSPVDGIDFLSDRKMFVAAPSVHPVTGAVYEWDCSPLDDKPANLPEEWKSFLRDSVGSALSHNTPILEGERNATLFKIGLNLRSDGITGQSLKTRLLEDNHLYCLPPLSPEEVAKIVDSILNYEPSGKSLKTRWQEGVLDSDLHARCKLTLIALSMFSDKNGRSCFPTQDQIAERASSDPKTVRGYLKIAEADGWIETYKRGRANGHGYNYGYILQLVRPGEITELIGVDREVLPIGSGIDDPKEAKTTDYHYRSFHNH